MRILKVTLLLTFSIAVLASGQQHPYYAVEESYALDPYPSSGPRNIICFIPRRYLLFIENRDSTIEHGHKDYLRASTQDGVEVLVLEATVSNRPFDESIGSHEVIYNTREKLCRKPGCVDEDEMWTVHPGDAFTMTVDGEDVILRGNREDNEIIGYLSKDQLSKLVRHGKVTRSDRKHPKYTITRTEVSDLYLRCGKTLKHGDSIPMPLDTNRLANVKKVLQAFPFAGLVNITANPKMVPNQDLGDSDAELRYYIYNIQANREHDSRFGAELDLVAVVKTICRSTSAGTEPDRIDEVLLSSPDRVYRFDLTATDFHTPDTISTILRSPYLFSVNTADQYESLMERLGDLFEDRALAGYFLAQFNRSCGSRFRTLADFPRYDYRK